MTKSITVMANISTNINETDSHLSTQIPAEHKQTTTYGVRSQGFGLGRAHSINRDCLKKMLL